jgi:uncharacterized protein (DUF362 family)
MPNYDRVRRPARSRVAIVRADNYSEQLEQTLMVALRLFHFNISGKAVLLKPNLVDFVPGVDINTSAVLVSSAAECFRRLGARSVTVAEGPGNQRDTQLVLSESGYRDELAENRIPFVDLNRDELVKIKLGADYTGLGHFWLPRTVLSHDFIVSLPKVKTHHWSGVTLSMKNMFGVVPGAKYGWPKNILHWRGIQQSILDICATVPIHTVIADAIVAMEGNGPLAGNSRPLHSIVFADDPVAADATCARLMGFEPERIPHIREAAKFLGNASTELIDQLANPVRAPEMPFKVVPEFEHLRDRRKQRVCDGLRQCEIKHYSCAFREGFTPSPSVMDCDRF